MKCDVHKGKRRDDCLRCFLPDDAENVRMHNAEGVYLFDSGGKTYACRQGGEGNWYETAPPRGVS